MTRCVRAIVAEELNEHGKLSTLKNWFLDFPDYYSEYHRCWKHCRRDASNILDLYNLHQARQRKGKGKGDYGKGKSGGGKGSKYAIGARYTR